MKLSYNWLKQYVDIDITPEELSPLLTNIGLEVEGFEKFQSVKGGLEGITIGEVKTCEKHPNADKLTVTTVDVGAEELLPIVCGAPNVAKGQKVLVATVGTTLYMGDDSFQIKKAKIRGEVSEGMICAEDELGLGNTHEGIMVLPDNVSVGTLANQYFQIEEDYVYEIGLTPNRADATSHIGSARDVAAGLNRLKESRDYKLFLPSVDEFKVDNTSLDIDVVIENPEACPRYSGLTISGLTVAESPDWLKNRLVAIGLRPINNIVDITNFVLHETGQPLHAFDADKIKGNKVVVKKMPPKTLFITLDEEERELHADDLMICDTEEGMCIGGVFGGMHSGVTDKTVNIFLESAYFDPSHIRKTSRRHTLQTDASFRFERGADPNITLYALKRAALLFKELAGGEVSSDIKDVYPLKIDQWEVDISYKNVDRLIGQVIDKEIIKEILVDLEIEISEESDEGLKLMIPTFKVDVTREADIIEEILRIYGYNNINFEEKINTSVSLRVKPDLEKIQNTISDQLTAKGFVEVINNSLTKSSYYTQSKSFDEQNSVRLLNPLSQDLDVMRQTLLFGGLEVVAYNSNRRLTNQKLYEFGGVYQRATNNDLKDLTKYSEEKHLAIFVTGKQENELWNSDQKDVDFYYLKGIAESLLRKLGIDRSKMSIKEKTGTEYEYALEFILNDKQMVVISKLSKSLLKNFDLKQAVYYADFNWDRIVRALPKKDHIYEPVAKYPSVRRDLALILDSSIQFEDLKMAALKTDRRFLKSVSIFDIYEGDKIPEGKKSYALSFTLQDKEKTLTDKVIDKTMNKIQSVFKREFDAELR